jgi:hypothetical protein
VIGHVGRSCPSTAVVTGSGPVRFIPERSSFLAWWPLLISQEWGAIWHRVYGSPAICRWIEPIVSRFMGRNQ